MRIAIHQPRVSYFVGGGEIVPLEQAKYLSQLGHKVTVVTSKVSNQSDVFENFRSQNPLVNIVYFELPQKLQYIYKIKPGEDQSRWDIESLNFSRLTTSFYQNNKFDLIAVHYLWDCLGVSPNQDIALHLHGFPHYKREMDNIILQIPDALISVSWHVKKEWEKMFKIKIPYLCYNGVDPDKFAPQAKRRIYDFLYMGRLIPIKGIKYLIFAFSKLLKYAPALNLGIAGEGPEKEKLIDLVQQFAIEKKVFFLGKISDEERVSLYNRAKICAFPSYAREGVPIALLESIACGVPVITTNCCSMPELIKNGVNGFLVKPKSSFSLAKAMLTLVREPCLQEKLARQARREVLANWAWTKRVKELERVYKLIISKRKNEV